MAFQANERDGELSSEFADLGAQLRNQVDEAILETRDLIRAYLEGLVQASQNRVKQ